MTSIASRAIRQAVLPVALLGLFASGCARFGHHGVQAATPGGGHLPQHVATRGTIPPEFLDLVTTKKAFANLATVMPNGSPQVTPIWFDFDGKYIRVNSARGRGLPRRDRAQIFKPGAVPAVNDRAIEGGADGGERNRS